jgi:hypothetical protein
MLLPQEQLEALEEHGLDGREMTRMLVSRPFACVGTPLPDLLGHLTNQRNDDRWRLLERVDNLSIR